MRTLIVSHYFLPEIGAPQARLGDLARMWAEAGDEVTVLTGFPNHPTGIIPAEYRNKSRSEEISDGYRIVRTWVYATPNEGIAKKTLGHLSFMASSVVLGMSKIDRPDAVVVSSPTFFSIFAAWLLARAKRAALIVEIRDLWPAIFVELGVLTDRRVIWFLERLEMWAYRTADEVVVVSNGFRDNLLRRGVDPAKVHVIRNGVDTSHFTPGGDAAPGRAKLEAAEDDVLVLYIGAHGISHGLDTVVEAAAQLQGQPIRFALVGEGAAKKAIEAQVAQLGLSNITMLPGVARDEVPGLLAAADICLVPLRDIPLFATFIPSKIFEYFGAGKAVIGAVRGEPAAILAEGGAVVVDPGDATALATAIKEVANDPARRRSMGRQARTFVEQHFNRRQLAHSYREVIADRLTLRHASV